MKKGPRKKKSPAPLDSREKARLAAKAAFATKAEDILLIKVGEVVDYTDYFVICSARSAVQSRSIAEEVLKNIHAAGGGVLGVEGEREGNWILIDWGEVVVHIFYRPVREFYELEKLWGDAPAEPFPGE